MYRKCSGVKHLHKGNIRDTINAGEEEAGAHGSYKTKDFHKSGSAFSAALCHLFPTELPQRADNRRGPTGARDGSRVALQTMSIPTAFRAVSGPYALTYSHCLPLSQIPPTRQGQNSDSCHLYFSTSSEAIFLLH